MKRRRVCVSKCVTMWRPGTPWHARSQPVVCCCGLLGIGGLAPPGSPKHHVGRHRVPWQPECRGHREQPALAAARLCRGALAARPAEHNSSSKTEQWPRLHAQRRISLGRGSSDSNTRGGGGGSQTCANGSHSPCACCHDLLQLRLDGQVAQVLTQGSLLHHPAEARGRESRGPNTIKRRDMQRRLRHPRCQHGEGCVSGSMSVLPRRASFLEPAPVGQCSQWALFQARRGHHHRLRLCCRLLGCRCRRLLGRPLPLLRLRGCCRQHLEGSLILLVHCCWPRLG